METNDVHLTQILNSVIPNGVYYDLLVLAEHGELIDDTLNRQAEDMVKIYRILEE
jgi:hypothetical protein